MSNTVEIILESLISEREGMVAENTQRTNADKSIAYDDDDFFVLAEKMSALIEGREAIEYEVDGWNNFCRVFQLPNKYPQGYCMPNSKPVTFEMVDWFNPVPGVSSPAVSKEIWREKVGEINVKRIELTTLYNELVPFLLRKRYIKKDCNYLVICNFGATFTFRS